MTCGLMNGGKGLTPNYPENSIMPMHRKNKAPRNPGDRSSQSWYDNRVKRDKARKKMAKVSRKKNRK